MASVALPSFHASSALEKVLEHRLVAELSTHLWLQGTRDLEVLRGEVDAHGYDIVMEANGIIRHIQLKAMVRGGKRRDVGVNVRLAAKPSGCVIWMAYDPATLQLGPFLWFGGTPRYPLPPLGERAARHSKGNAEGVKLERAGHRLVPRSRFEVLNSIHELANALFGGTDEAAQHRRELDFLRRRLLMRPEPDGPEWLLAVRRGEFDQLPEAFDWDVSGEVAHLINGYELVEELRLGDPFELAEERLAQAHTGGIWRGGPVDLWISLFLEHRRWRFAGFDPHPAAMTLIETLWDVFRDALTRR